jgi:hypothetical protein
MVVAVSLALLAYDCGRAAVTAHRDGEPWLYPSDIATGCTYAYDAHPHRVRLKRRRP